MLLVTIAYSAMGFFSVSLLRLFSACLCLLIDPIVWCSYGMPMCIYYVLMYQLLSCPLTCPAPHVARACCDANPGGTVFHLHVCLFMDGMTIQIYSPQEVLIKHHDHL